MSKGFSIIEIIIACAIFLATLAAFVTGSDVLKEIAVNSKEKTAAALYLEEGSEAILLLRDQGYTANIAALNDDTPYYLYWNGAAYQLSATEVVIAEDYWRRVTFYPVYRSGSGAYSSSGTLDPDTRRVRIEVGSTTNDEVLAAAEMLVHNIEE